MQHLFVTGDEPVPGYRLLEEIEGSAFFKVWRVQTPDGGSRSWKIVDLVVGNAAIETRTLGLLVRLRHPHLNTLTNFWNLDDGKTLIIESEVPARSLRALLDSSVANGRPGVPIQELLPYFEQAAEGLDFLNKPHHDYNGQQVAIYHRSLRPDCLLLFEDQTGLICKVSDFGLSKPVTEEVAQHSQGLLHYDYDPPEFFEGQTAPTSDQYALAVNYYELRTGQMPFRGTMLEQLQARLNDKPDLSFIDEPERSVVRKALHRDPARRFKSCLDFVKHLKEGRIPDEMAVAQCSVDDRAAASAIARTTSPSLSGITAPRPSKTAVSSAPAWRSPSTAAALPRSASTAEQPALPNPAARITQPAAANSTFAPSPTDSRLFNRFVPRSAPASAVETTVARATPAADTAPAKTSKSKPGPDANLRSIREHIGAGSVGFADTYTGERRVPIVWVVVVLSITALGSVWLTSLMGG